MSTGGMAKVDWETIVQEGKKLASLIGGGKVDLNEAQKVLEFYVNEKYDDARLQQFLDIMLHDPPAEVKKDRHVLSESYHRPSSVENQSPGKGQSTGLGMGNKDCEK